MILTVSSKLSLYINSSNSLPPDAFENVARNYGFDEGKLKAEYISFIAIYPKLRKPKDDRPFNETSPGPSDDMNRENFIAVLKVLSTFNLQSAFPELYIQDTGDTSNWFN